MPYIKVTTRRDLDAGDRFPQSPGELNYVLSDVIDDYLLDRGVSYDNLNAVMGVLACIQQEVYRRIAAPYEDEKLAENGEVFFSADQ